MLLLCIAKRLLQRLGFNHRHLILMPRSKAMLKTTGLGRSPRLKSTTSADKHVRFRLRKQCVRQHGRQTQLSVRLSCVCDLRFAAARLA